MKKYEKILGKMSFTINSTLISNDYGRKGRVAGVRVSEEELLRSSRRAYMDLKVMMLRLERELFGEKNHEENKTKISDRDTSSSNSTKSRTSTPNSDRIGDFSC